MSTYKALVGKKIKSVSSDPSDSADGQMWYNSTTQSLRGIGISSAWSSSAGQINSFPQTYGGGTQSAGWICGGYVTPPFTKQDRTEEYNGTGWTVGGTLNTARADINAAGLQTAGLAAMGDNHPSSPRGITNTEEYDGSSWTNVNSSPGGMFENCGASCGTQTTYVAVGGRSGPPNSAQTTTMEYDGTNWSTSGAYPAALRNIYHSGVQTASIATGGETDPGSTVTSSHTYDGSSWTSSATSPISRRGGGRAGTQTAALFFGGGPGNPAGTTTLTFDGTTFAVDPASLTTPMGSMSSSTNGTSTAAWACSPALVMEEYNKSTTVITAAAWAAGGNLNTARSGMFTGPIGSQTAGLAAGGEDSSKSNATEEYDGSSWTTVNTIPVSLSYRGGAGTQAAGLVFGGNPNPSTVATTNEYDGTNWTSGGDLNNARGYGPIASGTQTAALAASGFNPPVSLVAVTEYYNGSAWSAQPAASPQLYGGASGGTQTATWAVMGISPPSGKSTFEWDGSSWTTGNSYATDRVTNLFGGGPQTEAWMCAGDKDPGFPTSTNHYNGTAWATAPNVGTGRSYGGQAGTQAAGIIFGGSTPSASAATEEFTGETTAANVKTFSTS